MSTDIPTPNPRPAIDLEPLYAAAEAALIDYQTEPYGDLRLNAARASAKAVSAALRVLVGALGPDGSGKGFPGSVTGSAVPAEGSGHRCPSRIAHESGAVLGCQQSVAGHVGNHFAGRQRWADNDDRVITEGSANPQPATEPLGGSDV